MNKLLSALIEESKRVRELEIKTSKEIHDQNIVIKEGRLEKAQLIVKFVNEIRETLVAADAIRCKNGRGFMVPLSITRTERDGFVRTLGLEFHENFVYYGGYYIGSNDISRTHTIDDFKWSGGGYDPIGWALIDGWNAAVENEIELAAAKHIKERIEERLEETKKNLINNSKTYRKYAD